MKKTDSINIRSYRIDAHNKWFNEYAEKQLKEGKGNTCNLLPYSRSFHLSGPTKLFDISIKEDSDLTVHFFDIDNKKADHIPLKNHNTKQKNFQPKKI